MDRRNKNLLLEIIGAGIVLLINSCIVLPVYSNLSSDIFSSRILILIADILSALLDVLLISLLLSVTIGGTYLSMDKKPGGLYLIVSCGIIVLKHIADILVSGITFGFASVGSMDYLGVAVSALFYAVILAAAFFTAKNKLNDFRDESEKLSKAYLKAYGTEYSPDDAIFPFRSFFSLKHPLLYGLFCGSAVYLAIKIGSRIYYDIRFGAPEEFAEVIEMIIGYSGDIIESLLVYTCAFFLMTFLLKKRKMND